MKKISRKAHELLSSNLEEKKRRLYEVTHFKAVSGNEQDGWHDGNFQDGLIQEARLQTEIKELMGILNGFEVIEPEKQTEVVKIGNGILIHFEDTGQELEVILDGFAVSENYVSAESLLGANLLGKRSGERVEFGTSGNTKSVLVKEIYLPEETE